MNSFASYPTNLINGMKTMANHNQYFKYLMHRSSLGKFYRKYWLYPRLCRRLKGRTLDIGCGIGDMLAFRPHTVGVDINRHAVDFCSERGFEAHLMELDVLPFRDSSFESALLDNVLEHIPEPDSLLEEVYRILLPGGRLLVGVPGILGWKSDLDHKVFYDELKISECVEKHGFLHINTFHTPICRSSWLSNRLRQYCIYSVFQRV